MVDTPTSSVEPAVGESPVHALDAIAEAADVAQAVVEGPRDRVTLSNQVVLKLRPVPPLALREAAVRIPPPAIPTVFIADHGREEPNPADPVYIEALKTYEQDQVFRVADVLMLLGTSVESVPDEIEMPESDNWIDALEALDLHVDRSNKYKRYLSWLRLYAVQSEVDIANVMAAVVSLSGVTEVEVARAAAAFRRPS